MYDTLERYKFYWNDHTTGFSAQGQQFCKVNVIAL